MTKRADNLMFWLKHPSGDIKNKDSIQSIIDNSESLDTLYRKGINITSVYKFSELEEYTASLMGRIFFKDYRVIEELKRIISDKPPLASIQIKGELFSTTKELLDQLVKLKVIEDSFFYDHILPAPKGEKPKFETINDEKELRKLTCKKRKYIRISFLPTHDTTYRDFVVGHWFNAFAYNIVSQQLNRNKLDFEIYTRVTYHTPFDVFSTKSDFDILVLVNNKILMIECKSGRIYEKNVRSFKNVIKQSDGLKEVFGVTTRKFEYIPILVYNKKLVQMKLLQETFAKSDFHLIDIGKLRSTIDVFTTNIKETDKKKINIQNKNDVKPKEIKKKEANIQNKNNAKPKKRKKIKIYKPKNSVKLEETQKRRKAPVQNKRNTRPRKTQGKEIITQNKNSVKPKEIEAISTPVAVEATIPKAKKSWFKRMLRQFLSVFA
jgi:hypothetical protein